MIRTAGVLNSKPPPKQLMILNNEGYCQVLPSSLGRVVCGSSWRNSEGRTLDLPVQSMPLFCFCLLTIPYRAKVRSILYPFCYST